MADGLNGNDPSILTTQQLLRETANLKELILSRLAGMDTAVRVLQDLATKAPSLEAVVAKSNAEHEALKAHVDISIRQQGEVQNEKFNSIQTQFRERDVRIEQSSKDSKVAIDAALQAQEKSAVAQNKSFAESIGKSETGFTKQIDLLGGQLSTMGKTLDDKINDNKTRINIIETYGKSAGTYWGYIVGGLGVGIAFAGFLFKVMGHG